MIAKLSDPSHPMWSLLRLLILMASLLAILMLVAEKFDDTELKTIVGMFMVAGGIEGFTQYNRAKGKTE